MRTFTTTIVFFLCCGCSAQQSQESPPKAATDEVPASFSICKLDHACMQSKGSSEDCYLNEPPGCSIPNVIQEPHTATPCMKGSDDTGTWGCEGTVCPRLADDVQTMPGFHMIGLVTDENGDKHMHVADSCQHYFCAASDACQYGNNWKGCDVNPHNCLLVQRLDK